MVDRCNERLVGQSEEMLETVWHHDEEWKDKEGDLNDNLEEVSEAAEDEEIDDEDLNSNDQHETESQS